MPFVNGQAKEKCAINPFHITSNDKDHRGVNLKGVSGTEIL